jgi:hypothetical protein
LANPGFKEPSRKLIFDSSIVLFGERRSKELALCHSSFLNKCAAGPNQYRVLPKTTAFPAADPSPATLLAPALSAYFGGLRAHARCEQIGVFKLFASTTEELLQLFRVSNGGNEGELC